MTYKTYIPHTRATLATLKRFAALGVLAVSTLAVTACGGGGETQATSSPTSSVRSFSASEAAAMTPSVAASLTDAEVIALDSNIRYLSNPALTALSYTTTSGKNPKGQIESITPAQVDALSPAQMRYLGMQTYSGGYTTASITYLNPTAWAALVNNRLHMAAITSYDMPTLTDEQIVAMGANVQYLSNSALSAMTYYTGGRNRVGQIQSLLASQVLTLTPPRIRLMGALGSGGVVSVSQFARLGNGAWSTLMGDSAQVAAITAAEVPTIPDERLTAIGANIRYMSDSALAALSPYTSGSHPQGQIQSLSAVQIAALSPAQVRMLGALGSGGAITTSDIAFLNDGAWSTLVSVPTQVNAITPAEAPLIPDARVTSMGVNIQYLTDAALGALSPVQSGSHQLGQLQSISASQVAVLSPAQIAALATTQHGTGIAYLSLDAYATLIAPQVAVWTPSNITAIVASKLAAMTPAALTGIAPNTAAAFTAQQKSMLTSTQRSACGC